MSEFADAAISYAESGLAVFPLQVGRKEPATRNGFKDATTDTDGFAEHWGSHNIGIATGEASGGVFVIDLDEHLEDGVSGGDTLHEWEKAHGELPETVSAITGSGGVHLFYRSPLAVGCSSNKNVGVDIRGNGGYVVAPPSVHPNGRGYCWENCPEEFEVADADDNVIAFVEFASVGTALRKSDWSKKERFKVPANVTEGGRNNQLFKYAASMRSAGNPMDVIEAAVRAYNGNHVEPPLPKREVDRILASVANYEPGNKEAEVLRENGVGAEVGVPKSTRRFRHNEFAKRMMEERRMRYIDGAPAVWNGMHYEVGQRAVDAAMVDMMDSIESKQRREVQKYLEVKAPRVGMCHRRFIAFRNCVLDIDTMRTYGEPTPDMNITNVVPHDYVPDAPHVDVVEETLRKIAGGDEAVYQNLLEVIGMCMYRGTEIGALVILTGYGANGKSTYFNFLRAIIGDENCSAADMSTLGERFQTVPLIGKLANIGDDISASRVGERACSVIKTTVTGDITPFEYKGGESGCFRPYCTMVYSANEMPSFADVSYGFMRRVHPIPLNARFSKDDPDFDPYIEEKLGTEEAIEYAIALGVWTLKGCIERKGMMETDAYRASLMEIETDNNSAIAFAYDRFIDEGRTPVGRPVNEVYEDYRRWCDDNGMAYPFSQKKFTRHFSKKMGARRARKSIGGEKVYVFARDGSA